MSQYGTYDGTIWLHEGAQEGAASTDVALEVATGDTTFSWMCYAPCEVVEFGFLVTVAFDYATQTTEGVIALDKRVTFASDSGRVEVCRVDLEDALAISSIRFVIPPMTNRYCNPGDTLIVEVITQAAGGGGIAGDWVPYVRLAHRAETMNNVGGSTTQTKYTKSSYTQVV